MVGVLIGEADVRIASNRDADSWTRQPFIEKKMIATFHGGSCFCVAGGKNNESIL
jgi:hypothetical protein